MLTKRQYYNLFIDKLVKNVYHLFYEKLLDHLPNSSGRFRSRPSFPFLYHFQTILLFFSFSDFSVCCLFVFSVFLESLTQMYTDHLCESPCVFVLWKSYWYRRDTGSYWYMVVTIISIIIIYYHLLLSFFYHSFKIKYIPIIFIKLYKLISSLHV